MRLLTAAEGRPNRPDQEIFVDRARDETVIVELVDAVEDRTGPSLGAFEDVCDDFDVIERRLVNSTSVSASERGGDGVGDGVMVYGVTCTSKSSSTAVNNIDVWGAIVRLPRANTTCWCGTADRSRSRVRR